MTNKKKIITILNEIHESIPQSILDELMVKRVTEKNLDEFLARYITISPPNYLPVLELDGNIFGIHLQAAKDWKECAWVEIPHDSMDISILADSFTYFPYAFFTSCLNMGDFIKEIIEPVTEMLSAGLLKPDQKFIENNLRKEMNKVIATYHPENGEFILRYRADEVFASEVKDCVEEVISQFPDDPICQIAAVYLRKEFKYGDTATPSVSCIQKEIYQAPHLLWLRNVENAPGLLEVVREEAVQVLPSDSPFMKMKQTSYTSKTAAAILKEIAHDFNILGEEQLALNQLRNAAMIEGIYGGGMTKEWCLELAEQCDRVEKDSLAGSLARYAAEVVHLGP